MLDSRDGELRVSSHTLWAIRETIKEGRGAAREKVEGNWAAAFRKVKFPEHYIGLTAISGTGEV